MVKTWEPPSSFNNKPDNFSYYKKEIINSCRACGGSGNTLLNKFTYGRNKFEKIDCLLCKGKGYTVIKNGKIS